MNKNMIPLLGIAFVVALLSTGVFYGLFAGKLRGGPPDLPVQAVVVAARNLERGAVLKADDLRMSEWRGAMKLQGALAKRDDAAGMTLLEPVQADQVLLLGNLGSRQTGAGGASGVPAGMRAVSLHVFESGGVIALLRPGSRIDVQAVFEKSGEYSLRTVEENVPVLAVNPQPETAGRQTAPVVTVLTSPENADLLALADSGAKVRIALRNPLDENSVPRKTVALGPLFSNSGSFAGETSGKRKAAGMRPQQAKASRLPLRVDVSGMTPEALAAVSGNFAGVHGKRMAPGAAEAR